MQVAMNEVLKCVPASVCVEHIKIHVWSKNSEPPDVRMEVSGKFEGGGRNRWVAAFVG